MPIVTLKVQLMKPTQAKMALNRQMTQINTEFSNWLLTFEDLKRATSKVFKAFSDQKMPSAVVNQTIRDVKSKKRHQKAKQFRTMWCTFNNQNLRIEHEHDLYKVSFPTSENRVAVPLVVKGYHEHWLRRLLTGAVKQGATTLYEKKGHWFVAITLSYEAVETTGQKVMGIDVGFNHLAVASVGTNTRFFKGNEMGYRRRRFAARRKALGKANS